MAQEMFLFYVKKLLLSNYFISMFKANATESIFVYTVHNLVSTEHITSVGTYVIVLGLKIIIWLAFVLYYIKPTDCHFYIVSVFLVYFFE